MKERPILFSGPVVRAILDGRKTITRRVMRHQPAHSCRYEMNANGDKALHLAKASDVGREAPGDLLFVPLTSGTADHRYPCPYGAPGDRLWVRETWYERFDGLDGVDFDGYAADGEKPTGVVPATAFEAMSHGARAKKPSIFMRREHSRIALEVTAVRVERLQKITDADAEAEGVTPYTPPHGNISPEQRVPGPGFDRARLGDQPHRLPFADVWDVTNGKRAPWSSNPWVWVVSFRRIVP